MRRWFNPLQVAHVAAGDFTKWDFTCPSTLSGFLEELAVRAIDAYLAPIRVWAQASRLEGFNAVQYAERLFDKNHLGTNAFREFTGEVLAHWCSLSFTDHISGREPLPHDNTPGFDSISYALDVSDSQVCLIQAKTTKKYPRHHANYAGAKFGELDKGSFQQELSRALSDIASRLDSEDKKRLIMSALTKADARTYRVVVVHSDMPNMPTLTRYSHHIPGAVSRRNCAFIHFPGWDEAWTRISEAAYAYLLR
jgi:hypothetical protein